MSLLFSVKSRSSITIRALDAIFQHCTDIVHDVLCIYDVFCLERWPHYPWSLQQKVGITKWKIGVF